MIYDYPYYRNHLKKNYNLYKNNNYINYNNFKNNSLNNFNKKINSNFETSSCSNDKTNLENKYSDDTILNFLGIELSMDDLIILGVLYLLYIENVEDITLYLVLILLLLN